MAVGRRGPNQRPSRIELGTLPTKATPMPTHSPMLNCNCHSVCAHEAARKAPPIRNRPSEYTVRGPKRSNSRPITGAISPAANQLSE
jgi:hypothetical protein